MHGDLLPVHLKEEELRQSNAYCKERSTASRMKHFSVLLITLLATSTVANEYYDHAVWVDLRKSYQLSWRLNRSREIFVFKVDVKAVGWVGLGISNGHGRGLSNADLWLGWMDNDGKPFLKDCYSDSEGRTKADEEQNVKLIALHQKGNRTILEFERKFVTCDDRDYDIEEGTAKLIFAWSRKKPKMENPCSSFLEKDVHIGSKSLDLWQPTEKPKLSPGAAHFDLIHKKIKVPETRTAYWCTVFRISDLVDFTSPKHIVAFESLVQKRKINLIHHMVLFSCGGGIKDSKNSTYSGLCFDRKAPAFVQKCTKVAAGLFTWAPGISDFEFPTNVGYPLGTDDVNQFVLQVHINNELLMKDILDTSGLRVYYENPRKYEAAMITTGITMNDNMIIPPGMKQWTVQGVCTKACTEKMRPEKSIFLFASFPHAHLTAKRIRTTLVRDGIEIEHVVRENNFNFHYQHYHRLYKEVEVKPGDELFTYCTYQTLNKKYATLGGVGSDREMCLNFIMYYPKIDLKMCSTDEIVTQPVFTSKYAKEVYAECRDVSTDVDNWKYSNWTGVEWTRAMKKELRKFYNGDDPLPMVKPECIGPRKFKYSLPANYRPVVKRKLMDTNRNCSSSSRTSYIMHSMDVEDRFLDGKIEP